MLVYCLSPIRAQLFYSLFNPVVTLPGADGGAEEPPRNSESADSKLWPCPMNVQQQHWLSHSACSQ